MLCFQPLNAKCLRHRGGGAVCRRAATVPRCKRLVKAQASDDAQKMAQAMQDPKMQAQMKQMQQMMQDPAVQEQMQQMAEYSKNEKLQQRMKELKDDPEFAGVFQEIQSGGMPALMRIMNDPKVLAKLGQRLGDIPPPPAAAAAAGGAQPAAGAQPQTAPPPEVTDMLSAAKYGDMEAVEDFIAIGKDVNMKDAQQRTPLHYASGCNHAEMVKLLVDEGAEMEAQDARGNTPLHYAAGYGRGEMVRLLLELGASKQTKESTGKTAADLIRKEPKNPLNKDAALMSSLS